ncbi:uncharacterized protein LOC131892433 isoform X1 [Tigriopus californicus]|uniref:uncharacterized protein LOC131892433 isoform X1 n=1 Tax=Tigriopus californicus TaxID=6832 RepID=UPI0027D9F0E7|nr:uncharacterized protein LOC131892433 isoform X1 [Tigriopus californicus]XP_059098291.1 uncharacterized protein LOC131892433 isoform X1 [Tigriopus californicus]XP_059098292.1 uncharacterized protein LOC131892433 isoform X1 [Tigriopus californicus]XP_059098294.1 uncharacterized protein LOC131892433 isoform X1 [Tigriopus californicus]XP_059098295.1 uncharacterized protein LOC131892433 isoform X1 [Tigriopus californicus]XP_059098296.1 uncharacterized protein LOC131892433 isoform X1 [Tigriopus c
MMIMMKCHHHQVRVLFSVLLLDVVLSGSDEQLVTLPPPAKPTVKMLPTYQEMMRKHREYPTVSPRYYYEYPHPNSNEIPPLDESDFVEMKPLSSEDVSESSAEGTSETQVFMTTTDVPSNGEAPETLQNEGETLAGNFTLSVMNDTNKEDPTDNVTSVLMELEQEEQEERAFVDDEEEQFEFEEEDQEEEEEEDEEEALAEELLGQEEEVEKVEETVKANGRDEEEPLVIEEQKNNLCSSPVDAPSEPSRPVLPLFQIDDRLYHMRQTLLESLECGNGNCTQIIIDSSGEPFLCHPARLGLFTLSTLFEGYPVYSKKASSQHLFFKLEFDRWEYAHRIERWVVGPMIGEAEGGILFLTQEMCPWKIDAKRTEVFFYHKKVKNTWNPIGNGWKLDDSISINCYNPDMFPPYSCSCDKFELFSNGNIATLHPEKIGVYELQEFRSLDGILSPLYKHVSGKFWLYSHHHRGQLWLIGSSLKSWSLRLNLRNPDQDDGFGQSCPDHGPSRAKSWEYLQRKLHEEEIWKPDKNAKLFCRD